jgi:tetratricopeptide (TPR) repeat protein
MQMLEGEDLAERLEHGGLPVAEGLAVIRRAATALAFAHKNGVVHRDVKPSNLFLVEGNLEQVKILDFGIARAELLTHGLTQTGAFLGTVGYMAPEQAMGSRSVDARADVFSLGCVLFECLTGQRPFTGDHVVAILAKVLREEAPRLRELRADLPPTLDALLARMLAKDPAERPADAGAVVKELAALGPIEGGVPAVESRAAVRLSGGELRFISVLLAVGLDDAERVSEIARRHGADSVRLANGTLLVTLSSRGSSNDQFSTAAVCALELSQAFPLAQIALATGRALTTALRPTGPVIDQAAALLAHWTSSGVRIDEVSAGLLGGRFDVLTDGELKLLRGRKRESEPSWILLGKPTPCVGRDKELGLLEATLHECVEESVARAVIVTGPAGQGKSRLRREFVAKADARGDATILVARADPVGAGSSFLLARQLVRQAAGLREGDSATQQRARLTAYVGELCKEDAHGTVAEFLAELVDLPAREAPSTQFRSARTDPQIMATWLERAFAEWIAAECERRPLLVVLEDLHWGDLPSVSYLTEALRALAAKPLMVLALGRSEIDDVFPNLWAYAAKIHVPLAALPPRAAERLVRAALGDELATAAVQRLVARADGNVFYLEELIRRVAEEGSDELPETVMALAQSRLDRLEPEQRRLLRAASVFGEMFWSSGIAALIGSAPVGSALGGADVDPWLHTLVDREVIVPRRGGKLARGEQYTFRHGILREVAYSMLTDDDRVNGHRLAGEWLESVGETDAVTMAGHFERGGQSVRAIPWLIEATENALTGGDLDAVVEFGNRAIACGPSDADSARLRVAQTHAMGTRGDWASAIEFGRDGMRLLRVGSAHWFACASTTFLSETLLGKPNLSAQLLPALMDESVRPEPSAQYATAVIASSVALALAGKVAIADAIVKRAESLQTAESGPGFVLRLNIASAYVELVRDVGFAGLRKLEETAVLAERLGDALGLALGSSQIVLYSAEIGDFARAEQVAKESAVFSDRLGSTLYSGWEIYYLGRGKLAQHRPEAAIAIIEPLLAHQYKNIGRLDRVRALHACALVELGETEQAVREATLAIEGGLPGGLSMAFAALAKVELDAGRAEQALAFVERGFAAMHAGLPLEKSLLYLLRAETLFALGREEQARTALAEGRDRVLRLARTLDDPGLQARYLNDIHAHVRLLALARERLNESATA